MIVHHTALPYGSSGTWEFYSACFGGKSPLLIAFNGYNQSFFMGHLLLDLGPRVGAVALARADAPGLLPPPSSVRLGVPTLVYSLLVFPLGRVLVLPELGRGVGCGVPSADVGER